MHSTCIFCRAPLGANDVVERFPVGVRVAFDAGRGRLWAVCPRCRRWNLAPLEERWEAVEDCERLFPRSGLRVSTDNIGLARLADGTELVRIGRPVSAEVASWRWGGRFLRYARGAGVMRRLSGTWRAVSRRVGWVSAEMDLARRLATGASYLYLRHLSTTYATAEDGARLVLRGRHVEEAEMLPVEGGDTATRWALRLPHTRGLSVLEGGPALLASRHLLARLNHAVAHEHVVSAAAARLEAAGAPAELFGAVARTVAGTRARTGLHDMTLRHLPPEVRLSLEMAASEERERWAMEGELATLQREWREAGELAAAADPLRVLERVTGRLREVRAALRRGGGEAA